MLSAEHDFLSTVLATPYDDEPRFRYAAWSFDHAKSSSSFLASDDLIRIVPPPDVPESPGHLDCREEVERDIGLALPCDLSFIARAVS